MISQENFKVIFQKYLENQCSPEEADRVLAFLKSNNQEKYLQQILEQQLSRELNKNYISNPVVKERLEVRLKKILEEIASKEEARVVPINEDEVHRFNWSRIVAAAIVIVLLGFGVYYLFNHSKTKEVAKINTPVKQDIAAPTSAHATITLANGQKIILDSAGNGTLATTGNMNIVKTGDGQIAYDEASKVSPGEVLEAYNTLSNPRGSKVVSLTLSDGTQVWLNAESSLTYPTAFAGRERNVTITGEAYFEVSHNASMPFKVIKGETEITVLGTHFNVNAYDDEGSIKVTLLQGSVKVQNGSSSQIIKPGEQAQVAGGIKVIKDVNIDQVMAWKNGKFSFDHAGIKTVMRELSRWYDLDVKYEGVPTNDLFGGDIQRDLPLSKTLDFLKQSQVHFEVEGRKVIVKP